MKTRILKHDLQLIQEMKSNSIISSTGIHKFIQYIVMCVYCDANIQRQKDNEMYLLNMCPKWYYYLCCSKPYFCMESECNTKQIKYVVSSKSCDG